MIEWKQVGQGRDGLRVYRIEASPSRVLSPGKGLDPLGLLLSNFPSKTGAQIQERFSEAGSPVGASSLRVACHVVSLPDLLLVIDSTFSQTAGEVFPATLEQICRHEDRRLGERPICVVYTHAHFDHAGGRAAVEALGSIETIAHRHTRDLFPAVSRPSAMFRSRGHFLRDCGISISIEEMLETFHAMYEELLSGARPNGDLSFFRTDDESPLRVDECVELSPLEELEIAAGRVRLIHIPGHIPGHLCVLVDGEHFITGDMWLPATTSTVTSGHAAQAAGVSPSLTGVVTYVESDEWLLGGDLDHCFSYPSHEQIFRNPKRMAVRDLELLANRLDLVYGVLGEHRDAPMRVLDLAWGGSGGLPIWKVARSKYRLFMAHEEATSFVEDLLRLGDLTEVEPERYLWTGQRDLLQRVRTSLGTARHDHGHLEFHSRGRDG